MWPSFNQSDDLDLWMGCIIQAVNHSIPPPQKNTARFKISRPCYALTFGIICGIIAMVGVPTINNVFNWAQSTSRASFGAPLRGQRLIYVIVNPSCDVCKQWHVMWPSFNQSDDLDLWMGCIIQAVNHSIPPPPKKIRLDSRSAVRAMRWHLE